MRTLFTLWIVAATVAAGVPASAQTRNPDISVIGDVRGFWSERLDRAELEFSELELAFVAPVNPYAEAEAYIAFHGLDIIEIEEAKLMLSRYFPAGLGLMIGLAYLDFGQINPVHRHAYPWVFRPLMHEEFFGPDGARDTSVRLDWLAPIDAFTLQATAGVVRGTSLLGGEAHHHGEGEEEEEAEEELQPELGGSARLNLFFEATQDLSLQVGSSLLHGEFDPADGARVTWWDVDAKLRWDLSPQRELVLNAEAILGQLDASEENDAFDPNGWFAGADLRWDRRWNFGVFGESTTERLAAERTWRYGAFGGLALMEETTVFRLVVHQSDFEETGSDTGVLLQAIFALGPHRPHRY